MALVTSDTDMTVIILDNKETEALTDMLDLIIGQEINIFRPHGIKIEWRDLDELTNALVGKR